MFFTSRHLLLPSTLAFIALAVGCHSFPKIARVPREHNEDLAFPQATTESIKSQQEHALINPLALEQTNVDFAGQVLQASVINQVDQDPIDVNQNFQNESTLEIPTNALHVTAHFQNLLTLEQAKRLALSNSAIVRRDADFLSPINSGFIDTTASRLDPMITDSGFLYGQRGTAAALSDFDWRWSKQIGIGENELIQNNRFLSGGIPPGGTLQSRTGLYNLGMTKNSLWGGQVRLSHEWDYSASNVRDTFYPSSFAGSLRAELRQPLLAGAGRQVTSIAGPIGDSINGVTGVSQGVLIAKVQTQEAKILLSLAVSQLLHDVEILYDQLVVSSAILKFYDFFQGELASILQQATVAVYSKSKGGSKDLLDIQQAYYNIAADRSTELRNNQTIATRLSRLMGVQEISSELHMAPIDSPTPIIVDVESAVEFALLNRPDFQLLAIREQSLRNQLIAARNLNRAQLDFVSGYNINGFGDKLFAEGIPGPDRDTASAYENLFQNDHTGWDFRLELSSVAGRRLARTRELNLKLQLQKLAMLKTDHGSEARREIEQTSRDLQIIYDTFEIRKQLMSISAQRSEAIIAQQFADFQIEHSVQLAQAIAANATAQADLMRSQAEYANAQAELKFRQGRTLAESHLAVQ